MDMIRRCTSLLALLGILCQAFPAGTEDRAIRDARISAYDSKVLYYQRGFLFSPEHVVQNGRVIPVASEELNRLLSGYPSSRDEWREYHGANIAGLILIGSGVLAFGGGLALPMVWTSEDPTLVWLIGGALVVTGAALGLGGVALMTGDVKQNHLYRSIWYYNESVLFEQPDSGRQTGRADWKIPLFSYRRPF